MIFVTHDPTIAANAQRVSFTSWTGWWYETQSSQNVRSALRALLANKLRSGLTMLGIVIGVGAVVALLSIGTGAQASITNRITGIGANLITVFSGTRNNPRRPVRAGGPPRL